MIESVNLKSLSEKDIGRFIEIINIAFILVRRSCFRCNYDKLYKIKMNCRYNLLSRLIQNTIYSVLLSFTLNEKYSLNVEEIF